MRLGIDPEKIQIYYKLTVDDITIFYADNVPANFQTVIVKLAKLLFYKRLVAVVG
nr:hypothetical protein [Sporomusa silvacetica]